MSQPAASATAPAGSLVPASAGSSIVPLPTITEHAIACGLPDDLRDAMLVAVGATVTTPLKVFAHVSDQDIETTSNSVQVQGQAISVIAKASIRCFLVEAKALAAPPLPRVAPTSLVASPAAPGSSTTVGVIDTTRHSLVVNQVDDSVSKLIDSNHHVQLLQRYQAIYGDGEEPPPDHEPTVDQLSVLYEMAKAARSIYADFAIFGPHANRLQRKMKLQGVTFTADGSLRPFEITGPPSFEIWEASWQVYEAAMVMLDCIGLGTLRMYHDQMNIW